MLCKSPMITTVSPETSYFHHNLKLQEKVNSVTDIRDLLRYKYPVCYLDVLPTQSTFISMQ